MATNHTTHRSLRYSLTAFFFIGHARALCYAFGQLWRHKFSTLLTLLVLAIALALPSGFLWVVVSLKQLPLPWQQNPTITLYVKKSLNDQQIQQMQKNLLKMPSVQSAQIISPQKALAQLTQSKDVQALFQQPGSNPLPTVMVVTPTKALATPAQVSHLYQQLNQWPIVDSAQMDQQWVQRLFDVMQLLSRIAYGLAIIFALGVMLMTSNTMRLALQSHREEITVLRLIGTKRHVILRPLLYQGLWLGLLSSLIAATIILVCMLWFSVPLHHLLLTYGFSWPTQWGLVWRGIGILVLFSMILCTLAAWLSVRGAIKGPESIG
jgi:cell division transport system permease protein